MAACTLPYELHLGGWGMIPKIDTVSYVATTFQRGRNVENTELGEL